jgi:hypothetical protein
MAQNCPALIAGIAGSGSDAMARGAGWNPGEVSPISLGIEQQRSSFTAEKMGNSGLPHQNEYITV